MSRGEGRTRTRMSHQNSHRRRRHPPRRVEVGAPRRPVHRVRHQQQVRERAAEERAIYRALVVDARVVDVLALGAEDLYRGLAGEVAGADGEAGLALAEDPGCGMRVESDNGGGDG
jgi:hypothetical protein